VYRHFRTKITKNEAAVVRIQDLNTKFTKQSETLIRKKIKHCADFQRVGDHAGQWAYKEVSLLNVHSTFTQRSLNIHSTFTQRSLNVHSTFTQHSLNADFQRVGDHAGQWVYKEFSLLNVHSTFTQRSLNIHSMFTQHSLNVHST
jgi:hypothetical protein